MVANPASENVLVKGVALTTVHFEKPQKPRKAAKKPQNPRFCMEIAAFAAFGGFCGFSKCTVVNATPFSRTNSRPLAPVHSPPPPGGRGGKLLQARMPKLRLAVGHCGWERCIRSIQASSISVATAYAEGQLAQLSTD